MTEGFGALEIAAGGETVRRDGFDASFGEPGGTEVLVYYNPPATAHLHVYAREIADGALSCTLGGRQAGVTMDLGFAMRIVTEALRGGLTPPQAEADALRAALEAAE